MTPTGLVVPPGRQGPGAIAPSAVATLDLALVRRAAGLLPGEHRSLGVGVGTELAQLRPYEPGDDLRQLDPAASARTNVPHIRQQVPERALTTWILLDLSPSMAFGTRDRLKCDVAEGVTTVIGRLAVRRGGRIALMTCGAPTSRVLPPRGGRRALVSIARVLAEGVGADGLEPHEDLEEGMGRLRRLARQPGLIVIVSDFRAPEGWQRRLHGLTVRHGVVAIEIVDPREGELPDAGRLVLVDPESGRQLEADTTSARLRARFKAAEEQRRATLANELRRAGADHVTLSTEGDWLRSLAKTLR